MRSRPSAMPPWGGVPYSSASRKKPKRALAFLIRHAQRTEYLYLHVLAVNTDRARAKLCSVQHDVVSQRANRSRIGGQPPRLQIIFVRRSEGMMRRIPRLRLFIPFEEREIRNPEKFVILGGSLLFECFVPVGKFLRQGKPHLSRHLVESALSARHHACAVGNVARCSAALAIARSFFAPVEGRLPSSPSPNSPCCLQPPAR